MTFPAAFAKARKSFKELYSAEYEGKDAWTTNRSLEELIDLFEHTKIERICIANIVEKK